MKRGENGTRHKVVRTMRNLVDEASHAGGRSPRGPDAISREQMTACETKKRRLEPNASPRLAAMKAYSWNSPETTNADMAHNAGGTPRLRIGVKIERWKRLRRVHTRRERRASARRRLHGTSQKMRATRDASDVA